MISFLFLLTLGILLTPKELFYKRLFLISFVILSVLNLILFNVSVKSGQDGYSPLTKDIIDDEVIYFETAKFIVDNGWSTLYQFDRIQDYQVKLVGYGSPISVIFSSILAGLFSLTGVSILSAKFLISFISSICLVLLTSCFRIVGLDDFKSSVFSGFLLLYPGFVIRSVQLEKDILVLFLVILVFKGSLSSMKNPKAHFNRKYLLLLPFLMLRIQALLGVVGVLLGRGIISKISPYILLIIVVFAGPVLLELLKLFIPDLFFFVESMKEYSVLDGKTNVIQVDYSSLLGSLKTILISYLYYFLAPISPEVILSGSLKFRIWMLEPLIFFVVPVVVLFKKGRKRLKYLSYEKIFYFVLIFCFIYSLSNIIYESHVTSYIRKRIPLYILIYFLTVITIFWDKLNENHNILRIK